MVIFSILKFAMKIFVNVIDCKHFVVWVWCGINLNIAN